MVKKEDKEKLNLNKNTLGLAGFILGILSIIFAGNNGIVIGVIGLIFSLQQQKKIPTREGRLGVILNIIGIVLAIIVLIVMLIYVKPIVEQQLTAGGF